MRAGPYAVFGGETYRCVSINKPFVRLLVSESEPPPPGFKLDRGGCSRLVDRTEVSRLFYVETTAVWRGYAVSVDRVKGDKATIGYMGSDMGSFREISQIDNCIWQGTVSVSSLSEIVEQHHEIDL